MVGVVLLKGGGDFMGFLEIERFIGIPRLYDTRALIDPGILIRHTSLALIEPGTEMRRLRRSQLMQLMSQFHTDGARARAESR
jgi:hypothetical protein